MNHTEFMRYFDAFVAEKRALIEQKGRLYGSNSDRLDQFYAMANLTNTLTAEECAYVLASKHFTALGNILFGEEQINLDILNEIIGDIFNYMILIGALTTEGAGGCYFD